MRERARTHERVRESDSESEREPWPFGSSFYMFPPPPGPALCNLGQPGALFVLPEVLTLVLRLSFVLFSNKGFSLPRLLATAILDSFFLF